MPSLSIAELHIHRRGRNVKLAHMVGSGAREIMVSVQPGGSLPAIRPQFREISRPPANNRVALHSPLAAPRVGRVLCWTRSPRYRFTATWAATSSTSRPAAGRLMRRLEIASPWRAVGTASR